MILRNNVRILVLFLGFFNILKATDLAAAADLLIFKNATLVNDDEIALSVNFIDETRDPYPKHFRGYNVDIDYSKHCYVQFMDEAKKTYKLVESSTLPEGEFGVFKTHTGPCGVCSSLQDLAAYLETPDLTTPVTRCAKMLIPENKKNCLRKIGFTERCMYIWYWNTIYTRRGCFNICIRYQYRARNQPVGTYNPCKPIPREQLPMNSEDTDFDTPDLVPGANDMSAREDSNYNPKQKSKASSRKKREGLSKRGKDAILSIWKKKVIGCRNYINNGPACKDFQWQNNPQRLNPCLQCDECKSGPMFQKVSGRQRRNSGIQSGIGRPLQVFLDHHYHTGYQGEGPARTTITS